MLIFVFLATGVTGSAVPPADDATTTNSPNPDPDSSEEPGIAAANTDSVALSNPPRTSFVQPIPVSGKNPLRKYLIEFYRIMAGFSIESL